MANKIVVTHNGNGLGDLYLADVGKRFGLGGGALTLAKQGQDQYIKAGETVELMANDEALMSATKGIIARFAATGQLSFVYQEDATVMPIPKVTVEHVGTKKIYLNDITKRYSLGGSIYLEKYAQVGENGQDMYINPGDIVELVATETVLKSMVSGSLHTFSDMGELSISMGSPAFTAPAFTASAPASAPAFTAEEVLEESEE